MFHSNEIKTLDTQTQFQQRFSPPSREFGTRDSENAPILVPTRAGLAAYTQRFNALPLIWKASILIGSVYGVQWLLKSPMVTRLWSKMVQSENIHAPEKQSTAGADVNELSRLNGDFSKGQNSDRPYYAGHSDTIPSHSTDGTNYTFDENPLRVHKDPYPKSPIPM